MKENVTTYWFVEPKDAQTKEVIVSNLLALSPFDKSVVLEDIEGKEHDVFQVENYFFISRIYRDRNNLLLQFKIFSRQGKNGKLNPWKFGN